MAKLDLRTMPARGDIAAAHLEGTVDADRFVDGVLMQVSVSVLSIRKTPHHDGPQETQMLFGETFTVYDEQDGWGWGQAASDGYVGYVSMAGLVAPIVPPSHRVTALRTYRFSKADLKSLPLGLVSMNARLTVEAHDGPYCREARGGWVWAGHTAALGTNPQTPIDVAEQFLGTPYLWGGRDSLGLDCSALIQNAFDAAGIAIPRDSDQQEHYFHAPSQAILLWDETCNGAWHDQVLARGDIVYWAGHTGMMIDDAKMVHANATFLATTIDHLAEISTRWVQEKNLHIRRIIRPILPASAPGDQVGSEKVGSRAKNKDATASA